MYGEREEREKYDSDQDRDIRRDRKITTGSLLRERRCIQHLSDISHESFLLIQRGDN